MAIAALAMRHPRSIDKLRRLLYVWHQRLGHLHNARFHTLIKRGKFPVLKGVTASDLDSYLDCAICKEAKSMQQPHRHIGANLDGAPLEHFAVDIKVLPRPSSWGGITNIVVVVCLATKRGFVFPLKSRGEEPDALERLRQHVLSRGHAMRTLRHDKSGEQTSTAMDTWCVDNNIVAQPTTTDSHEQNGVVERKIGILSQMTRALMLQGGFPKAAYFELFSTSNFLQDRLPTVAHDWVSAFEVSERKSFPFHGLRVVGCDAYVHTPGGAKAQAMPSRKGKLIGYSADSHGYRVLMDATTGDIVESTDVTFHETTTVPGGVITTVITSAADDENPVESRYPVQTASPPPRTDSVTKIPRTDGGQTIPVG